MSLTSRGPAPLRYLCRYEACAVNPTCVSSFQAGKAPNGRVVEPSGVGSWGCRRPETR